MSTEPDWSSFTLPELLEQAGAYGNKASSGSLRTSAFLERALERSPEQTDLSDEIMAQGERTKQAYQVVAAVTRDIASLAQAFPQPMK